MSKPSNPFRYFNSSPEVIRLVVMMGQHTNLPGDPLWQKLIGEAFASELELLDRFAKLELMVMRERNRVLECRDKRHVAQIEEVRAWIDAGLLASPPVKLPTELAGAVV